MRNLFKRRHFLLQSVVFVRSVMICIP